MMVSIFGNLWKTMGMKHLIDSWEWQ